VNDTQFGEFSVGRPQVEEAMRDQALMTWALAGTYSLSSVTRDSNDAIVTAAVTWPNGQSGVFTTITASTAFPGAVDSYSVTYLFGAGGVRTITQPTITRDSNGAVAVQPALVLS
jgi:hypothetical protein